MLVLFAALFLLPQTGFAQSRLLPVPDSDTQIRTFEMPGTNLATSNDLRDVTNMPVFNPDEGARIRIYAPPEDWGYNMPVYGYKELHGSDPELLNFDRRYLPDKEK